jgi:hypothetical protein
LIFRRSGRRLAVHAVEDFLDRRDVAAERPGDELVHNQVQRLRRPSVVAFGFARKRGAQGLLHRPGRIAAVGRRVVVGHVHLQWLMRVANASGYGQHFLQCRRTVLPGCHTHACADARAMPGAAPGRRAWKQVCAKRRAIRSPAVRQDMVVESPLAIAPLTPATRRRTSKSLLAPHKAKASRLRQLERQDSGAGSGAVFMRTFG